MTCGVRECDYEATRVFRGSRLCDICYLERSAVDVRKFRRTLKADAHTSEMFGDDE